MYFTQAAIVWMLLSNLCCRTGERTLYRSYAERTLSIVLTLDSKKRIFEKYYAAKGVFLEIMQV